MYYRLQLVDKDSRFSFSKVLMFDLGQTSGSLRVFPNPAVNEVTVSVRQEKAGNAQLILTDMKGTMLMNAKQLLSAGNNSMTIDCRSFASGTYLLSLQTADGARINEKLVIRH